MLGATLHLFVLSPQTPMCKSDENQNIGNIRMQNVLGNDTLAASMYNINPTSLYSHVDIVNNPMTVSSNKTE